MNVLTAPTNLGNRPYERDGTARQTDRGPGRLREHGVVERLHARDLGDVPAAPFRDFDRAPGTVRNEDLVAAHTEAISSALRAASGFTLVLGGDCSTLLGCLDALRPRALVFLDGHTDFNTPETSQTGGVAGMDLALVTGRGATPLARRFVEDEDVIAFGIREGDFGDAKIRVAQTPEEVLARIGDRDFFVHVDADVLDPSIMPFVDTPEPNGLSAEALTSLLGRLVAHPRALGAELTIYDPRDDDDGRGAALLVDILENAFRGRR
jgi:arginase